LAATRMRRPAVNTSFSPSIPPLSKSRRCREHADIPRRGVIALAEMGHVLDYTVHHAAELLAGVSEKKHPLHRTHTASSLLYIFITINSSVRRGGS
jgi:hypothetical protein